MEFLSTFDTDELLALADIDFQKERNAEALFKLKALIARNNTPIQAYALLGRIYATIGLFPRAQSALRFFIDNNEGMPSVNERFQLGLVESDLGNTEEAINIWSELLTQFPDYPPALYHKAKIFVASGKEQEAIVLLNHILETAQDGDAHISLADKLLSKISVH
ncbi:tetratricopeptide repeat protein [Catenovulum sediminis]|uniref:tetratricopeptide repeat protein n=1 Tax=Catenovulum sediminis TaxID=1740262 RepID=UPI00117FFCA2|nr:tetratricopeptide repeat protein [Catenovulum sediminis]